MKAPLFPVDDPVWSTVFAAMAAGLPHTAFVPTEHASVGERTAAQLRRPGFWDWLDRWAWKIVQKEREAYLSKAQNLCDLEERIRRLDSHRERFF